MGLRISDPNNDTDQENQNNGQQGQNVGGQPGLAAPKQLSSGESSTSGISAPGKQPGSFAQRTPSSSGNFTDIGKYKAANELGAQKLGQNVTNKIDEQGNAVRQQVDKQNQNFTSGLGAETTRLGGLGTDLEANKTNLTGTGDDFTKGVNALTAAGNATYGGPQGLENVGALQQAAGNVKDLAAATKTGEGRLGLLQRFYQAPDYTSGKQRLDSALLGSQGFGGALKSANQLGQSVSLADQAATNQANSAVQQAAGLKTTAQTAGTDAESQIQQLLKNAGKDYITSEQARAAGSGYQTPQQLTATANANNYGFTGNTIANNPNSINFSQTLTPDQLMQLGAVKYNPDQGVNIHSLDDANQLAVGAGVDPNRVSSYNQLVNLVGGTAMAAPGQALQQGSYDITGLANLNGNYQAAVQKILGQQSGLTNVDINPGATYQQQLDAAQGRTGPQWQAFNTQLQQRIKDEALNNLYSKYGIVARGSTNPQGAV